jgi:two-component system cell cycle sensor histidine kinase/response regulator CckA
MLTSKVASFLTDVRLIDRPGKTRRRPLPELRPLRTRRTVVVVDDEPMVLDLLVRVLQQENYDVVSACSGPQALVRAAEEERIDLLVTDYYMPDMNGRELAGRLRERFPDLPVLYQTGFSDMLFDNRPELEAASAFLEKPFTARGLIEAARLIQFGSIQRA